MSFTYGFYNAENHDRRYNATHFSRIFDGIINDGVFMNIGKYLVVRENAGMYVTIGSGRAWFNHTWSYLDRDMVLKMEDSTMGLNRIDAVVLEVNESEEVRQNSIKTVMGTPASNPVRPTLTDTELVHQHPLAYVYIAGDTTSISQANITNCVGTSDCPFVTGILETANIDFVFAQWQSQWNNWVTEMRRIHDEDFQEWAENVMDTMNAFIEYTEQFKQLKATEYHDKLVEITDTFSSQFTQWFTELQGHVNDVETALQTYIASVEGYIDASDLASISRDILDLQHRLGDNTIRLYVDNDGILHAEYEVDDGT